MRRPDLADRRIESDRLGVGDVVAELSGFAGVNGTRGNIETADGEFRATELLDGEAIVFALLLGLALLCFPLEFLVGFVARVENIRDIKKYAEDDQGRIEEGILKGGFRRRGRLGNHEVHLRGVSKRTTIYFTRNSNGTKYRDDEIHLLAGRVIFA
jgi:hypothetical protein